MINICGLKVNLSVSYPVCKEIKLSLFCANKVFSKEDHLGSTWVRYFICQKLDIIYLENH